MHKAKCQAYNLYKHEYSIQKWITKLKSAGVYSAELKLLEDNAYDCFGYFAVHLGISQKLDTLASFSIHKKLYLASHGLMQDTEELLYADPLYLPFADNSCDLVVIHHLHEQVDNTHQFIREATRIVRNEGVLFVIGTRANFWQLLSLMYSRRKQGWQKRLLSSRRLQDWLKLMEFLDPQIYYDTLWYQMITKYVPKAHIPLQWLTSYLPVCRIYCIKAHKHQKAPVIALDKSSKKVAHVLGSIAPPSVKSHNS